MYQLCRSVSGIADAEWQKITHLIYLDTFLPGDGESLNDLAGPERAAADHGDGWLVPPPGGIPDTMPTEGANGSKAWRAHTL
jgi:hypothetical protein